MTTPFESLLNRIPLPHLTVNLYSITGWIGSVSIGLSLLIAPLINILIERFGCRPVAIIGTIVAASALLVTSFLKSLIAVFIVYGLVFGVGGGLMTICCYDAVLLYFPVENNVRAMGLLLSGTSFGQYKKKL